MATESSATLPLSLFLGRPKNTLKNKRRRLPNRRVSSLYSILCGRTKALFGALSWHLARLEQDRLARMLYRSAIHKQNNQRLYFNISYGAQELISTNSFWRALLTFGALRACWRGPPPCLCLPEDAGGRTKALCACSPAFGALRMRWCDPPPLNSVLLSLIKFKYEKTGAHLFPLLL
jgi:hypothetical protein